MTSEPNAPSTASTVADDAFDDLEMPDLTLKGLRNMAAAAGPEIQGVINEFLDLLDKDSKQLLPIFEKAHAISVDSRFGRDGGGAND